MPLPPPVIVEPLLSMMGTLVTCGVVFVFPTPGLLGCINLVLLLLWRPDDLLLLDVFAEEEEEEATDAVDDCILRRFLFLLLLAL